MSALRNTTRGALSAGDVTFPAGGSADLPEGFDARVKGDVVFAAWLDMGWLVPVDACQAEIDVPEPDNREAVITGVIRGLPVDDEHYTKAGKPEVDAINGALPEAMERVTAAERDAVWKSMEG